MINLRRVEAQRHTVLADQMKPDALEPHTQRSKNKNESTLTRKILAHITVEQLQPAY